MLRPRFPINFITFIILSTISRVFFYFFPLHMLLINEYNDEPTSLFWKYKKYASEQWLWVLLCSCSFIRWCMYLQSFNPVVNAFSSDVNAKQNKQYNLLFFKSYVHQVLFILLFLKKTFFKSNGRDVWSIG